MSETKPTGLALLRVPFPAHQISKLPKESKAQADERKANRDAAINCPVCGGWHHKRAVHLDYVGHAALTDRLLDCDEAWTWEPVAHPESLGLPTATGGMWIKLTVCGVSRLGFGHAGDKSGGDAVKEIIGDALRNAAMRFGAALDLWHKGDLHKDEDEAPAKAAPVKPEGFDAWALTLDLVSKEGTNALKSAWMSGDPERRAYMIATNAEGWAALKEKAAEADKKVAA